MLVKLNPPPGFVADRTDYAAGPRWVRGDKVRFNQEAVETIGGWQKLTSAPFEGSARALVAWNSVTDKLPYSAFATNLKLYVEQGGTIHDITPATATGTLGADPLTSGTAGTATVTVSHASHGLSEGDRVTLAGATAVDGLTLADGEYEVLSVPSVNSYTVEASSGTAAVGGVTGGGAAVTYTYLLGTGPASAYGGRGWGAGKWGVGTWGTPRDSTIPIDLRSWSLDLWGEDLIACPGAGGLYRWDLSGGTANRATKITNSPDYNNFVLVSPIDRHLIAFGSTDASTGNHDPMLIRWCSQEDYEDWTPSLTNTAGDQRLGQGSKLIGAQRANQIILVWSDTALYGMQFIGPPYTFGFQTIADNCGLVGAHAATVYNGLAYWMGPRNFFVYDGTVRAIPCDVRNFVFDDLNEDQYSQVFAGVNKAYGEILWLYPSAGAASNDRYVVYQPDTGTWYFGTLERTAWLDNGSIWTTPIATSVDGYLYLHEVGTEADGQPLEAYVESGEFEIGDGDRLMFLDRLIPDLTTTGTVRFTLKARAYPNGAEIVKGPYDATASTTKIDTRIRGRQLALRIESATAGTEWRLGTVRGNLQPDGLR